MNDAEDYTSRRETAGPLFDGPGPFDGSKVAPDAVELVVGQIVWRRRGRANAIPLAKLMAVTGRDERAVRGIVEQLRVTHRMRIGATEAGYFIVETAGDLEAAIARPKSQIFAMWRTLAVLMEPGALAELHGQLRVEGRR